MKRRRGALRGDGRSGRILALRVNTKLGTCRDRNASFPRVHDDLGGCQQTLQIRLGRKGASLRSLWNNLLEP
jgi:hypothetical protein